VVDVRARTGSMAGQLGLFHFGSRFGSHLVKCVAQRLMLHSSRPFAAEPHKH
jgi:hypothetical protein